MPRVTDVCSLCRNGKLTCKKLKVCKANKTNNETSSVVTNKGTVHYSQQKDNNFNEKSSMEENSETETVLNILNERKDYNKPLIKESIKNGITVCNFYGPLSIEAICDNNNISSKFIELSNLFIETEEISEKCISNDLNHVEMLQADYSDTEISKLIETVILPNYKAFKERLVYFDHELQNFFFEFIPIKFLMKKFEEWFVLDDNSKIKSANDILKDHGFSDNFPKDEHYIFNAPEHRHEYSILSLIVSLVRQVNVFTEHIPNQFFFELGDIKEEMNKLTLMSFAYSEYQTKPSYYSLIALITIRNNVFFLDMSSSLKETQNQIFSSFKIILDVAFNLGIHTRSDLFINDGIDEIYVTHVWNFIQIMDRVYGVVFGKQPLINYNHCIPRFLPEFEPIILILIEISDAFNSLNPISISEMIQKFNKFVGFASNLPSFQSLIFDSIGSRGSFISNSFKIVMKSLFLAAHQILLYKIRYLLEDLDCQKNFIVNDLKENCENQITVSFLFSFRMMKEFLMLPSYCKDLKHSNIFITTRSCMAKQLSFSYYYLITNFSLFEKKKKNRNITAPINNGLRLKLLDLKEFEENVFSVLDLSFAPLKSHFNGSVLHELSDLVSIFKNDLTCLKEIFLEFYNVGSKDKAFSDPIVISKQLKLLLTLTYLLETIDETNLLETKNSHDSTLKIKEWNEIIEKTKSKLRQEDINLGNLDNELDYFKSKFEEESDFFFSFL
ncbi:hypothetical protein DAMA08_037300 [Martiniozyma asiatica (nom. inval.)]|nr:hypothetical protein DAMA08_037300 [Martiniozyma asiatica]